MAYINQLAIQAADSPSIDAFGRWRTSDVVTLFDSKQLYDTGSLYWDTRIVGNATASFFAAGAAVSMSAVGNPSSVLRQTKRYFQYQPGKCVSQDEPITLFDGTRVKAIDLVNREFELPSNISGSIVSVKSKAEINAYEDVFEIATTNGNQIIRNRHHPLWIGRKQYKKEFIKGKTKGMVPTFNVIGWVELQNIQIGDYIAITDKLDIFGHNTELTDSDAKLIGYMLGDGSMGRENSSGISFTQQNGKRLDEMKSLVLEYGCQLNQRKSNDKTYGISSIENKGKKNSNKIINLLRRLKIHGLHCHHKRIPTEIFESPKPIISVFLSRLFATDGWAGERGIGYCSTSKQLILDLKDLLLKFGIHGRIRYKWDKNPKHHASWSLELSSKSDITIFASEIGIFSKEDGVNRAVNHVSTKRTSSKETFKFKNIERGLKWEEVKSIKNVGKNWTVAIETESHTYLTSFYEHNSHLIVTTADLNGAATDAIKRVGYYDDSNGIFFQVSGSSFGTVLRKNGTDTFTSQSSWNLDVFNGTGTSGKTIDLTKSQIYFFDFEWLGVGRVRYGIYQAGIPTYVHQITNVNALNDVYMSNPNLPVRYEIINSGSSPQSILHICSAVASEGGYDNTGVVRTVNHETTTTTVAGNTTNGIVAIRLNGVGSTAFPVKVSALNTSGNNNFSYALYFNAVTGSAWVWQNIQNSPVQWATASSAAGIALTDTSTKILGGYVSATSDFIDSLNLNTTLGLGNTIAGESDTFVLAVRNLGGTNQNFVGSITFQERT